MSITNPPKTADHGVSPTVKLSELTLREDIDDDRTDTLLILRHSASSFQGSTPADDIVINVHSGVLRVSSPFFMRGFDNLQSRNETSLCIGEDGKRCLKYTLLTSHPYAVQRIVYYIYKYAVIISPPNSYRNDYQNVNEEVRLLVPMYQESARFGLCDLKKSILRIIRSQHSIEVLANLSYVAENTGEVELARDCGRILADAAFAVFSGKLLQRMGTVAIKALVESDNLQLDEVQTFTALCHFFESNLKFVSPYSSSSIGPKEKDMLKHIRFCSMAPKAIDQLRHENLNSFLLDATLRILQGKHKKARHFPWRDNADYTCVTYNGLFPVLVARASREQLGGFDPNSGNAKLTTPHISKSQQGGAPGLSFTTGTDREMSICSWAFEVSKTKGGNIAFGVTFESPEAIDDATKSCYDSMSKSKKVVFYHDFREGVFKSGYIEPRFHRQIRAAWTYESHAQHSAYKLKQRDIVTVDIAVASGCITLGVGILNTTMRRSFQIPYKSNTILGTVLKRPCVVGSPFFMLHDVGDSLSIPELRSEFKV